MPDSAKSASNSSLFHNSTDASEYIAVEMYDIWGGDRVTLHWSVYQGAVGLLLTDKHFYVTAKLAKLSQAKLS